MGNRLGNWDPEAGTGWCQVSRQSWPESKSSDFRSPSLQYSTPRLAYSCSNKFLIDSLVRFQQMKLAFWTWPLLKACFSRSRKKLICCHIWAQKSQALYLGVPLIPMQSHLTWWDSKIPILLGKTLSFVPDSFRWVLRLAYTHATNFSVKLTHTYINYLLENIQTHYKSQPLFQVSLL